MLMPAVVSLLLDCAAPPPGVRRRLLISRRPSYSCFAAPPTGYCGCLGVQLLRLGAPSLPPPAAAPTPPTPAPAAPASPLPPAPPAALYTPPAPLGASGLSSTTSLKNSPSAVSCASSALLMAEVVRISPAARGCAWFINSSNVKQVPHTANRSSRLERKDCTQSYLAILTEEQKHPQPHVPVNLHLLNPLVVDQQPLRPRRRVGELLIEAEKEAQGTLRHSFCNDAEERREGEGRERRKGVGCAFATSSCCMRISSGAGTTDAVTFRISPPEYVCAGVWLA